MFSIIVCSISPESAENLHQNIAETIGVPFEFIAFDNRGTGRGICSVYNECARRAKYDLLCFVHEDIAFQTKDWGGVIARKLAEPDCGVIGFAGGIMKLRPFSSWCVGRVDRRENYTHPDRPGLMTRHYTNPENNDFTQVVCLDGMCLMTSRHVWETSPFDEELLTGFHAYDLDFTTAAARNYKNYTCFTVDIEHFSAGKYSSEWIEALQLYHQKWQYHLPMFACNQPSAREIKHLEIWTYMRTTHKLLRMRLYRPGEGLKVVMKNACRHPLNGRSWMLIYKYLLYYSFSA